MPTAVIAAGIAGIGTIAGGTLGLVGANKQADATQSAAEAQLQSSREALAKQEKWRQEAIDLAKSTSAMSAGEIAATNRVLQSKQKFLDDMGTQIQKLQTTLDQVDPVVKESGKQVFDLLQGKNSQYLDPVMNQRTRERTLLEQQLSQRLGPGFRTSSAGIEALDKFDQGTTQLVAQVQQNAITEVGGVFSNAFLTQYGGQRDIANLTADTLKSGTLVDQSVMQLENTVANRTASNVVNAASANPVNYNNPTQFAGAPFIGAQSQGQTMGSLGNQFLNIGANLGSQMLFKELYPNTTTPQNTSSPSSPTNTYGAGPGFMQGNYGLPMPQSPMNNQFTLGSVMGK